MNSRPAGGPACRCRRSVRAPSIDELFANGPHAGTQAFEVGDPDLDPERSTAIEASLTHSDGPGPPDRDGLSTATSPTSSSRPPTGEIEDDLPVFAYRQGKANYYGFELRGQMPSWAMRWASTGAANCSRRCGPCDGQGFRPGAANPAAAPDRRADRRAAGQFDGRIEVEHAFAQNRTAPLETETRRLYVAQCVARLAPARATSRS